MKNYKIIITVCLTAFTVNVYSQITVNSVNGKVGINNSSPSYPYQLELNGDFNFELTGTSRIVTNYGNRILFHNSDVYTDNDADIGHNHFRWDKIYISEPHFMYYPVIDSDRELKKDIQELDGTLDNILNLRPVKYKMLSRKELFEATGSNSFTGLSTENVPQIGLIAQEVQEIFPEMVSNIDNTYLGIKYTELVPILIKGLQEQQEKIEQLKAQAETMENDYSTQNGNLKRGSLGSTWVNQEINNARLYQNEPSPIDRCINIRFKIPESVQDAQLYFCDISGRLLKAEKVDGAQSVSIETNGLIAGKYLYSLVCDGSIVDTKQILLTE